MATSLPGQLWSMWQGIHSHDAIVEQFRRSITVGRLASSYLFVGPDGVGKRSFALQLGKAILCERAEDASLAACGDCPSCIMCDAGTHPDLHRVGRPAGSRTLLLKQFIGDGEKRNKEGFCHDFALRPKVGRRRVGIIDDADGLMQESANALLKLIEEPPPGALLILIGTSRSRQLPTILSRVQVIRFHGLPVEPLAQLVLAEGLTTDEAAARQLAEKSGGSLARARDLADPQLWPLGERFSAAWRRGDFDPIAIAGDFDEFIAAGGKEADARRQRFRQLLLLASESLRQTVHEACRAGAPPDAALQALDRCLEAEQQLDRNANLATLLECWLDDLATISEV